MSTQSSNNIDAHRQNSGVKKERQHAVKQDEIPRGTRSDLHVCNLTSHPNPKGEI